MVAIINTKLISSIESKKAPTSEPNAEPISRQVALSDISFRKDLLLIIAPPTAIEAFIALKVNTMIIPIISNFNDIKKTPKVRKIVV